MSTINRLAIVVRLAILLLPLIVISPVLAAQRVILSEATYVMADKDTLSDAERFVLERAQRNAIEQAGIYVESTFYDIEHTSGQKAGEQRSSLAIRTLAAAILQTTVLDRQVYIDQNRPTFYVRIRALVEMDRLNDAIRHLYHKDLQTSRALQLRSENTQLRNEVAQLRRSSHPNPRENFIQIETPEKLREAARLSSTWPSKIDLTTRAIAANPRDHVAYAMRGHSFLGLARTDGSITQADRLRFLNLARSDFSMSLSVNATNTWALFGLGEMFVEMDQYEAAVDAYWRLLQVDPLFDLGRQRMLAAAVALARARIDQARWPLALPPLDLLLGEEPRPTWVPQQAEAYLMRSLVHTALRQPDLAAKDLTTLLEHVPDHGDALYRRGRLYQQVGAEDSAQQDLARACRLGIRKAC